MERERLLGPGALEDFEHLGETFPAFGVGDAVSLIGAGKSAAPDAEDQPAMADVINRCGFLGDPHRMTQRQDLNRNADLHALGPRRDGACDIQRRRENRAFGRIVQFRQPHDIEPRGLGFVHLRERFCEGLGFGLARPALKFVEHAEFHVSCSP